MFLTKSKSFYLVLFLIYLFLCVSTAADSIESMDALLEELDLSGSEDIDALSSEAEEITDTRLDGISFEASRATCSQYLRYISSPEELDDFSKPGFHNIRLFYPDTIKARQGNALIQWLIDAGIHKDSSWEVELNGVPYDRAEFLFNISLLHEFLTAVPNIMILRWSAGFPIPRNIVELLELQHPSCRLYYSSLLDHRYRIENSQDSDRQDEILKEIEERRNASQSILNSTILYSLSVGVQYGGQPETERMRLIHQVLTVCPNVRELDLSVGHSGCVVTTGLQPHGFNFEEIKNPFPPLESLTLKGYDFEGKPNGEKWMEWEAFKPLDSILYFPWNWLPTSVIESFGYAKILSYGGLESYYVKRSNSALKPGEKTNLDSWLEVMDWSKLHTLTLFSPSPYELEKLSTTPLPSLKNVSFAGGYRTAITHFLGNTSSLESISIKNECVCSPDDILDAIYPSHNKTLKALKFHRGETHQEPGGYYYASRAYKTYHYPASTFLNTTHISSLLLSFPQLQALDIDLYLNKSWEYTLLDAIAAFPNLIDLTLRIEEFMPPKKSKSWERMGRYDEYDQYEGELYVDASEDKERMIVVGLKAYLRRVKRGKALEGLRVFVDGREVGTGS